jgi:hypothetical protein
MAGREGADQEGDDERVCYSFWGLFLIFVVQSVDQEYDVMWIWILCMIILGCWSRAGVAM